MYYRISYRGYDRFLPMVWRDTVVSPGALSSPANPQGSLLDSRMDIIRCSIWRVRHGGLDIQSFAGWSGERRCVIDIILTILSRGGLRDWLCYKRLARQYLGGHKEKQERYYSMI